MKDHIKKFREMEIIKMGNVTLLLPISEIFYRFHGMIVFFIFYYKFQITIVYIENIEVFFLEVIIYMCEMQKICFI